jgi:hypothetical protein
MNKLSIRIDTLWQKKNKTESRAHKKQQTCHQWWCHELCWTRGMTRLSSCSFKQIYVWPTSSSISPPYGTRFSLTQYSWTHSQIGNRVSISIRRCLGRLPTGPSVLSVISLEEQTSKNEQWQIGSKHFILVLVRQMH